MKALHYLTICLFLFASCSKDDDPEPTNNGGGNNAGKEEIIRLNTAHGEMFIYLYEETTKHRANFLKLAGEGFYDSCTFHRTISNFMIQGGDPNSKDSDPNNDGNGGPGYTIPAEILPSLQNLRGTLAAARLGNASNPQKESSGSQFYINLKHNSHLDGEYTVFGEVLQGMDAADIIVAQPTGTKDRPITDIRMDVDVLYFTKEEVKTKFNFDIP